MRELCEQGFTLLSGRWIAMYIKLFNSSTKLLQASWSIALFQIYVIAIHTYIPTYISASITEVFSLVITDVQVLKLFAF